MDGLTQYLALKDGVTAPLVNMTKATDALMGAQEKTAAAVGKLETKLGGLGSTAKTGVAAPLTGVTGAAGALSAIQNSTVISTQKLEAELDRLGMTAGSTGDALSGTGSKLTGLLGQIKTGIKGVVGQFALGNVIGNFFLRMADAAMRLPGEIMDASDAYAGMVARLRLVTGSAEEADQMNRMIYQSALKARGSYDGMADAVSKIAMTAKEAFPDPKEVVPFVEGIQKLFAIGGTGVMEQRNAMLQLQQGLGSGKLQGDEFRSIAEAAPLIEQMAAKYLGVTQGQLKELSSQGLVTAEVLKAAILENLDEINADFAKMPVTWEQTWQSMATIATRSFSPVYETISGLANSDSMRGFVNGFTAVMPIVGGAVSGAINLVVGAVGKATDMLSYMAEWAQAGITIIGNAFEAVSPLILGGLAGWAAYLAIVNAGTATASVQTAAMAVWHGVLAARVAVTTAATAAWTAVTHVQTAAMVVLNAVMNANPLALIARLVFIVVAAFVAWMAATKGVRETIAEAFSFIAGIAETVLNGVLDMINGVIRGINKIAAGINSLTGTKISMIATIDYRATDWSGKTKRFVQDFDISKAMDTLMPKMGELPTADYGHAGADNEEGPAAKATADNTKGILDAMDIMDEDIKFFQDVAEREAINRYTTASVNINLSNTNNVSNDVDVDGMVTRLVNQLNEAALAGAEAVHS